MLFTHLSEIIQFVLGVGYILGHVNVKKVSVALQISGPGREGHTLLECCFFKFTIDRDYGGPL